MKTFRLKNLLVAAVALLLTAGCATTSSTRTTTATVAAERGAPPALVSALQRGARLSLADIETLSALKTPDVTTLAYLRQSGASYKLTLTQIDQMRGAGVSPVVIDHLLSTPARVSRTSSYSRVRFGSGYSHRGYGYRSRGFGHNHGRGSFGRFGGCH